MRLQPLIFQGCRLYTNNFAASGCLLNQWNRDDMYGENDLPWYTVVRNDWFKKRPKDFEGKFAEVISWTLINKRGDE